MIWYEYTTVRTFARPSNANGKAILYHRLHLKTYYRKTFMLAKNPMSRLIHLDPSKQRLSPPRAIPSPNETVDLVGLLTYRDRRHGPGNILTCLSDDLISEAKSTSLKYTRCDGTQDAPICVQANPTYSFVSCLRGKNSEGLHSLAPIWSDFRSLDSLVEAVTPRSRSNES